MKHTIDLRVEGLLVCASYRYIHTMEKASLVIFLDIPEIGRKQINIASWAGVVFTSINEKVILRALVLS